MTYPYVQAAFDYGARRGPALAFVVHMAEGGGTVGYLSRSPDRGVSVHYVIEYSGRIVQMLHEDRASGSINPNELRTSDDADHFYGATVRKSVMGIWDHDPNSAVISLEIEGFATAGPNLAQGRALIALVDDVRSRHPSIGLLGHRDFTSTKACPGRHIDWPALGGHGPHTVAPVTEDPVGIHLAPLGTMDNTPFDAFAKAKIKGAGHSIFRVFDGHRVAVADGLDLGTVEHAKFLAPVPSWTNGDNGGVVFNYAGEGQHVAVIRDVALTPLPAPPVVDCTAAANTAYDEGVHAALAAATNGITSLPKRGI